MTLSLMISLNKTNAAIYPWKAMPPDESLSDNLLISLKSEICESLMAVRYHHIKKE